MSVWVASRGRSAWNHRSECLAPGLDERSGETDFAKSEGLRVGYLHPPYWGCEDDYGRALFSRERFKDLAGLLRGLKGRFILSLNDLPEVRDCFFGM